MIAWFRNMYIGAQIAVIVAIALAFLLPGLTYAIIAAGDLAQARDDVVKLAGAAHIDRMNLAAVREDAAEAFARLRLGLFYLAGMIVIVALTAVGVVTRLITAPAIALVGVARLVAAGDLTHEVRREGRNEAGDLQEAFAEMIGSIRTVVGEIDAAAVDLQEASGQMAATSDEAGRSVGEVARAISSISEGAAHQVDLVTRAQEVVAEIDVSIRETAQNATLAQQESSETRELAQEGVDRAAEVQSAMNAVRESALSSAEVVQNLGEKSGDIDQIVSTITEIAGQTNLLALNAAIEAARAGEQGRGFAVVADEVRQLAEDSQRAAGSIAALIKEIQSETGHAVDAMREGVERVEAGSEVVSRNRQTFADIQEAVERFHDRSTQISALADRLRSDSDRVRQQIEDVASVAEQSSASTEQVSASTEETSAAAEQVSASAQSVANTAIGLAALAKRFKVARR